MGDVDTLTVAEYLSRPWPNRLGYRLLRNPLVMFGLGPLWALMLEPRLEPSWARARFGRKIIATDVAFAGLVAGLCAVVGWRAFLIVQMPTAMLAGAVGVWLFTFSISSRASTGSAARIGALPTRRCGAAHT